METISGKVRLLEQENKDLKSEMERMKQFYGDDYKPIRCQECAHFCQHYGKDGNHYYHQSAEIAERADLRHRYRAEQKWRGAAPKCDLLDPPQ